MNNYDEFDQITGYKNKSNLFKYIIFGIIGIVIVLVLFLTLKDNFESHRVLENRMIRAAKNYVKKNNLFITKETYIEVNSLNVELLDNCSNISGVLVDSNLNYTAYLMCQDYESDIIKNDYTDASLNGREVLLLNEGDSYAEAGFTSNNEVKVNGEVGTTTGVYNINYNIIKNNQFVSTLKRKIIIVKYNVDLASLKTKLDLNGNPIEYVGKYQSYVDKGYRAFDPTDGDITNLVKVSGSVDTNVAGEYTITYTVTNSSGYTTIANRVITVVQDINELNATAKVTRDNISNKDVTIIISISGSDYSYITDPDGNRNSNSYIVYTAKSNGVYNFEIYDNKNNRMLKSVYVGNIDKVVPTGGCSAISYPTYTSISIDNTSKEILGYNYVVNGVQSGFITGNSYIATIGNSNSAVVNIKDAAGNHNSLTCNITYADPTVGNNKVTRMVYKGIEYVVINSKIPVNTFVKALHENSVSQNGDTELYGSACLSFAYYYSYAITNWSDIGGLNIIDGGGYKYGDHQFNKYRTHDKSAMLTKIFDSTLNGESVVLRVQVSHTRESRHFMSTVGYRSSVLKASDLKETDLLVIDSWDGNLEVMDPQIFPNYRPIKYDSDGYELRVLK